MHNGNGFDGGSSAAYAANGGMNNKGASAHYGNGCGSPGGDTPVYRGNNSSIATTASRVSTPPGTNMSRTASSVSTRGTSNSKYSTEQQTPSPGQMDYFSMGMRPCMYQFPGWVSQMVSEADGRVTLMPDSAISRSGSRIATPGPRVSASRVSTPQDWVPSEQKIDAQHFGGSKNTIPGVNQFKDLHEVFDPSTECQPWDPERFVMLKDLQESIRNKGMVRLMWDRVTEQYVAAKVMPNSWVGESHEDFLNKFPEETEWPWQDVGCVQYLNSIGFTKSCQLYGVHRDAKETAVITTFADEGDLFAWVGHHPMPAGPEREEMVRLLFVQLLEGMKQLHELSIVHRDMSMENCLVSNNREKNGNTTGTFDVSIIDFGMARTQRHFTNEVRGKRSYQAPECHVNAEYDAFLADVFALGVCLYCMLLMDYPWQATTDDQCKCFQYVKKFGLRAYVSKRKKRNTDKFIIELLSEPVMQLLEGMLSVNPNERLTLGEKDCYSGNAPSVWDQEWLKAGVNAQTATN
jgi:hypothetical protein